MKIYRAIFHYNNGDYCEWEQWYKKYSPWYAYKYLAERHLAELNLFKNYVTQYFKDNKRHNFQCLDPRIEEQEVHEEYAPFSLDYNEDVIFRNN